MPKFSESERVFIKKRLFSEGERLFIKHGIKKVTVDDLTKASGIAKGSFYAFYANKEHLYLDILESLQEKILASADAFLQENSSLPPKELVEKLILRSYDEVQKYPFIMQLDSETTDYLFRKLPPEVLEAHFQHDTKTIEKLVEHGIRFNCDISLVQRSIQALTLTFFNLRDRDNGAYSDVIRLMVSGVVNEIIADDEKAGNSKIRIQLRGETYEKSI